MSFFACLFLAIATLDTETLPYQREQNYSMAPYQMVVIYSAKRTGSSLIYNVFRYLFEEKENLQLPHSPFQAGGSVRKTHDRKNVHSLKKKEVLCVVPIRHPVDASISLYRVRKEGIKNVRDWCERQIHKQLKYLRNIRDLKKEGYSLLLIQYEEIESNLDALLQKIERHFSFAISPADKERIQAGYCRENVAARIDALTDFKTALPLSGFHGRHISDKNYTPPDEVLHWLNYYYEKNRHKF